MLFTEKLASAVANNNSLLCVGLDPDISKMPAKFKKLKDPLFAFNKDIIDATADLVCAYKPNSAFYEAYGADGIEQLKATADYIKQKCPGLPILLDAKRADIGNTNDGYVSYVFDYLGMDAVTLHPYLGREALEPFLSLKDKGLIILCRTSNPGAGEFQDLILDGAPFYQHVAKTVSGQWDSNKNCLLVVGATYPKEMKIIRDIVGPDMPFLVPGVGAQGGDVEQTVKAGTNKDGNGLIISSSRATIYASNGEDFAEAARKQAMGLRDEINKYLKE